MGIVAAKCTVTDTIFQGAVYETIELDFQLVDRVFEIENAVLAESYRRFGRCLTKPASSTTSPATNLMPPYLHTSNLCLGYPRQGAGVDAYIGSTQSDLVKSAS